MFEDKGGRENFPFGKRTKSKLKREKLLRNKTQEISTVKFKHGENCFL